MIELRIHGRGGQGNVVAAYLMAAAAIKEQRYGQAFPAFGAERRGAPVQAFVRIADVPIRRRSQVAEPDFLIIQDQALLHVPGVLLGLRPGGGILINSTDSSERLSEQTGHPTVAFGATAMAKRHLGRPVPNTALLAAFLSLSEILPIGALAAALSDRFGGKILERNLSLIEAAAQQVPGGIWKSILQAPEVVNG